MSKKVDKDKNQHIQVIVRCRPLNSKEKKQGGFNVVDTTDREVHVKDRSIATAPTKTFNYDKVYGPNTKQIEVYKHVVSPLVDEVLSGYNCTVFAYGQTGTGKTFTMEGERTDKSDISWEDDPLAGIIPRAMHQLFTRLTLMGCEFSVRVSFLEIYNEELIDLLGAESVENPRLRIYEDSARKGSCIIQGLEEVVVRDKNEVYKIMETGSMRRQTAATQMNAHSSRSHSLFMVTVHIKENSVDGEEMLKTGKLNLVDLAGSECIGRSGAIDKRAREAGNINQSLLTLGRVITALVEHAPHVPYRESKLTRLLQDSLGGRTKTSIIATISPASHNLDETLSTLDYAYRAKNITNRPEINQRLSKKTLLKEYNEEIERLRRDLQAARDKNGVYLAQENYDEMQTKIQQQRDSIADLNERIDAVTKEMMKVSEMFTETKEELEAREEELAETKDTLSHTQDVLQKTRLNYQVTIQDRDEQRHLVVQHIKSENQLSSQANNLLSTANDATSDVSGLHAKLDRKRQVEQHNENVVENFRVAFRKNINEMTSNLQTFTSGQIALNSSVKDSLEVMQQKREEEVAGLNQDLAEMVTVLTERLGKVQEKDNTRIAENQKWSEDLCNDCLKAKDEHETEDDDFQEKTFLSAMLNIQSSLTKHYDSLQQLDSLRRTQLELQQTEFTKFASNMEKRLHAQIELANELTVVVKENMTEQRKQLQRSAASHKALSEQLAGKLMTTLKEQLDKMTNSQQQHVESTVGEMQNNCSKVEENVDRFAADSACCLKLSLAESEQGLQNMQEMTFSHSAALNEMITEQSSRVKSIQEDRETLQLDTLDFKEKRKNRNAEQTKYITERIQHHMSSLSDAHEAVKESLQSATKECCLKVETSRNAQSSQQGTLTSNIDAQQHQLVALSNQMSDWSEAMGKSMEERDADVERLLTEETLKDMPTGTTPKVRDYVYPRQLTRMDRHSLILRDFRSSYVSRDLTDLPLPNNSFDSTVSEVPPLDLDADIGDYQEYDQNTSADSAISSASIASTSTVGEQPDIADAVVTNGIGKENQMKPPKASNVPKNTRARNDRSRSQSSRDASLTRKTPTPKKVVPASKTPTQPGSQRQSRTRLPLRTANATN